MKEEQTVKVDLGMTGKAIITMLALICVTLGYIALHEPCPDNLDQQKIRAYMIAQKQRLDKIVRLSNTNFKALEAKLLKLEKQTGKGGDAETGEKK